LATLKDISEELGLSVATVSRALNGFPEVSAKTRTKVRTTAEKLGYRPNRVAQRLVTGRSGMVGMIVKIKPDLSADQTFFEILTGLTAALSARDTDLVLAVDQGEDLIAPYRRMLERDILDGFILNAPTVDDPRIAFLQEKGIPFVMHGQADTTPDYPFYGIDNEQVSADAVELLRHLGHKRIALLNGNMHLAYAAERLTGYRRGMRDAGLPAHPSFIADDIETESEAYRSALAMLADQIAPTGFICASTVIAAGAMRAVRDRKLSVPRDVSVIAHDDALPLTRAINFDPALTVTRAPLRDACVPLANALIDHIGGAPAGNLQTKTVAELIIRGSTGPAPDDGDTPWP